MDATLLVQPSCHSGSILERPVETWSFLQFVFSGVERKVQLITYGAILLMLFGNAFMHTAVFSEHANISTNTALVMAVPS